MTTMTIVLVSVLGLGGTTELVLNKLKIAQNVNEDEYMENKYHEERGGWIVRWEGYLYRFVVRGASHISIPGVESDDSNSNSGHTATTPSPVNNLRNKGTIPPSPLTSFHPVDEDENERNSGDVVLNPPPKATKQYS